MSGSTAVAERNPWVTRLGAVVFLALAVGLALSVGSNARMQGYGERVTCGGYHQPACVVDVSDVSVKPAKPVAGKGFTVFFTSGSGGKYSIKARRKGATKSKTLSTGATGTGEQQVGKIGKKLKAGEYRLTVKVTDAAGKSDSAKRTLRIKKP